MKKYCLIGKSLPHTLSPQIHNEFGLDYCAVELSSENELCEFIKSKEYDGFNVTIPYKEVIIKYLDSIDEVAKEVGAVNTVKKIGDKYVGYNTDIGGMQFALEHAGINVANKKVMILGSGGVSKTAQYIAKKLGATEVVVVSRSGKINYANFDKFSATQVLINATPVGMMPDVDKTPIDLNRLPKLEAVFDTIYNPFCTKLIFEAKEKQLKVENGLLMLVEQARLANEIFKSEHIVNSQNKLAMCEDLHACEMHKQIEQTNIEINRINSSIAKTNMQNAQTNTIEIAKKLMREKQNIVLIGMAGAGKSTIGKLLANKTGKEFVDTDFLVEQQTGEKIVDIFQEYGEQHFRILESNVIVEVSKLSNTIIATGGGAVLDENNRRALKSNGKVVLILREHESLELSGRPLYKNKESADAIWELRKNIYLDFCDVLIKNDKNLDKIVNEIMEQL